MSVPRAGYLGLHMYATHVFVAVPWDCVACLELCVLVTMAHDVLCSTYVCELTHPAMNTESCVCLLLCLPLGGMYVYIVLYIFWGCECYCGGYVFLCDGLSVYILAQPQEKACRSAGSEDCAWTGSPQPGGLMGNEHVLTSPESIASPQRVPVQAGWVARKGARGNQNNLSPPPTPYRHLNLVVVAQCPGPALLWLQAPCVMGVGQGPETHSVWPLWPAPAYNGPLRQSWPQTLLGLGLGLQGGPAPPSQI